MPRNTANEMTGRTVEALPRQKIKDSVLEKIGIFRTVDTDRSTGEQKTRVKMAFYWNTPYTYDANGEERPFQVIDGFVHLTGHQMGNFVKIVKALGLGHLLDKDGAIRKDVEFDVEFGANRYNDYTGLDYDDLPVFDRNKPSTGSKKDLEVECQWFKLDGVDLIGRHCDLQIDISDSGWNYVEQYIESDNPAPLDGKQASKPAPKKPAPSKSKPQSETKQAPKGKKAPPKTAVIQGVQKLLEEGFIPEDRWVEFVANVNDIEEPASMESFDYEQLVKAGKAARRCLDEENPQNWLDFLPVGDEEFEEAGDPGDPGNPDDDEFPPEEELPF